MSTYKLIYFDVEGRAEPIRWLLSYAGVNFEDKRIARDAWKDLKPKMPLEQLPVLEVDGKVLYQSNAIIRSLGHKFNLFGSSHEESFDVDASLETIRDFHQVLSDWFFTNDAARKSATKEETFKKANFYLGKLEDTVKKNGGYFVNGKLTVADIVFASSNSFTIFISGQDLFANYPSLKALVTKVADLPAIKSYIAKRPKKE